MSTGKNGKESRRVKPSTKTRELSKIRCSPSPSMAQMEEAIENFRNYIKLVSVAIYSRWTEIERKLSKDMIKKKNPLEKARSQLKKAEHAHTPASIKRKLQKKEK